MSSTQTTAPCNYCGSQSNVIVSRGMRDWEYGVSGEYTYLLCQACGGIQLHPFPELSDLHRAYDIDYHGYAAGQHRGFLFSLMYRLRAWLFRRRMARFVDSTSRVLDVGCGAGDFLQDMARLGLTRLEGIDFSQDMADRVEALGFKGFCGTFPDFPQAAQSYQLVAMNNYLEHTLEPDAELAKACELLEPGGVLVGEVPCFDSWERRLWGRYWGGNHVPRHTYQFSPNFLERQLRANGFDRVVIKHQLNTSHWALSVQNFMQRHRSDLRHNPAIYNGRSSYYVPLLLLFIPINLICMLARKTGCIQFIAHKGSATPR